MWNGDLVVGLRGNVARYAGSSVTFLSTGMPATANVQALASVGGVLWAGTDQTLYEWNGATWVAEPGFGFHDVRAITGAGGVLRAATADAGILKNSGSWAPDNGGILSPGALSFATAGSDLYAGTAGSRVYRFVGSSWDEAGSGLWAASISDVAGYSAAGGTSGVFASARGAGLAEISTTAGSLAGPGCADVRALAQSGSTNLLAATNCDVTSFFLSSGASFSASSGLPLGVLPTTLARLTDGSIAGGTPSAGMWRYTRSSSWSADNGGLSGTESIVATREVGGALYASTGTALFVRKTGGWVNATGAPPFVQALGGDSAMLFAAPATGIAAATLGGSLPAAWRADDFGANTAFVSSLDTDGAMAFAAAGTAGALRKKDGGWEPENAGLPSGADVRVVRFGVDRQLFAGTAGNGLFVADTAAAATVVPVVLDVPGLAGAHFRSDLTLGNRSDADVTAFVGFSGAPDFAGSGSGTRSVTIPPRSELRIPDALQFLRDGGVAAGPAPAAGSLSISTDAASGPLLRDRRRLRVFADVHVRRERELRRLPRRRV